jgi:hypothetical protein
MNVTVSHTCTESVALQSTLRDRKKANNEGEWEPQDLELSSERGKPAKDGSRKRQSPARPLWDGNLTTGLGQP